MKNPLILTLCLFGITIFSSCSHVLSWSEADALNFPEDYLGEWKGPMQIIRDGQVVRELEMKLEISPVSNDRYNFILTYLDEDITDERPYELIVLDKDKGRFEIDEKNSVILPLQRSGNQLTSWFSVMGQQLFITYTLYKKRIDFEVAVSNTDPAHASGGGIMNGDSIPEVGVYPLLVTQRGRMMRVKK